MNGGQQTWKNYFGAILKFTGTVSMNSGSKLTNNDLITITGAYDISLFFPDLTGLTVIKLFLPKRNFPIAYT
jgi:hypothetical protein